MNKILIILIALFMTGCVSKGIVKESVYVPQINQCKDLPMPDTYKPARWHYYKNSIVIDDEPYLLVNIPTKERIIINAANVAGYIEKLKILLMICRK